LAVELTARGVPTPNGAKWHGQTVRRMIDRAGLASHLLTLVQLLNHATESLRSSTASFVLRPCLYIPLRFPFGPPPCYHD